jgi:uncharacterized Tic20 family protein
MTEEQQAPQPEEDAAASEETEQVPQGQENAAAGEQTGSVGGPEGVLPGPGSKEINRDARRWAMFCHLAGLCGLLPVVPAVGSIIGPLIIWQIKKDDFRFVDDQGKEAVNFQISVLLYALIGCLVCVITCVGIVLIPFVLAAVYVFDLVFLLIAGVKANSGEHYRYPLTIRLIK